MRESCAFLVGNREVKLCGCIGVEKYALDEIVLDMTDMRVAIKGNALMISTFRNGEISVAGAIEGVLLMRKGR